MSTLRINCNPAELDLDLIHGFLSTHSYWARGIPVETVKKSVQHSLCFGAYLDDRQVAFARVVTDYATFGYLGDVFVLTEFRGRGYAKALMQAVIAHPQLQSLRRLLLATSDAHALYTQFGFTPPRRPQTLMERYDPDVYTRERPGPTDPAA